MTAHTIKCALSRSLALELIEERRHFYIVRGVIFEQWYKCVIVPWCATYSYKLQSVVIWCAISVDKKRETAVDPQTIARDVVACVFNKVR